MTVQKNNFDSEIRSLLKEACGNAPIADVDWEQLHRTIMQNVHSIVATPLAQRTENGAGSVQNATGRTHDA